MSERGGATATRRPDGARWISARPGAYFDLSAFRAIFISTRRLTSASGSGLSGVKRIVPLLVSKSLSSSCSKPTDEPFQAYKAQWFLAAAKPGRGGADDFPKRLESGPLVLAHPRQVLVDRCRLVGHRRAT